MGGVSEGPTRGSRRGAICVGEPRDRGGGGHPGLRDGGVLRGTSSESRPRSVRTSEVGLLPSRRTHRRQRVSRGRRGRERRPHGLFEAHAPGARGNSHLLLRPSTRPSLGPLTRARHRHCNSDGSTRGGGAVERVSRSGKPGGSQEEPAPGPSRTDDARLAACTPLRKEAAWHVRKGRASRRPSPRGSRARSRVPVRSSSCRNRQATSGPKYARQTRSKKSGQGRVNGGLGRCERRRSHVGERLERNDESRLGSLRTTPERDREKAQDDVRASSSGRLGAESARVVAGPGL